MRTAHAIEADDESAALLVMDVCEDDYDYVAIGQNNQIVIISREQLPTLIRQLSVIAARAALAKAK